MARKYRRRKKMSKMSLSFVLVLFLVWGLYQVVTFLGNSHAFVPSYSLESIPSYQGEPYVVLNDNQPYFSEEDYQRQVFESYSELDFLGRVGVAFAHIGQELMPTEDRESISSINPTGWVQKEYDIVSGKYLYNRCHLIGYQLTGENDNEKNLMTCTRSMNVDGMLPFENEIAEYIKTTNHHVLYRVTPIFEGNHLLASGVQLEASSIEDHCASLCFNVYIYNVEDGITIDYQTGESQLAEN